MRLNIQLCEAFLESPHGFLSIHQIAKQLQIPYGTAYNRIHLLEAMGVVLIKPQGKAKLCVLNPNSPMTSGLLGLGGAKATSQILRNENSISKLLIKVRETIETHWPDQVHSALLLNFEPILQATLDSKETTSSTEILKEPTEAQVLGFSGQIPLDLFIILSEERPTPELDLEPSLLALAPADMSIKMSLMVVTPTMLLSMLHEKENDAGLSAYLMLYKGLILLGFEKFWHLILKVFGPQM